MTGNEMVDIVRRVLRDYDSTSKPADNVIRRGQFWDDAYILLVLNAAQDIVLNYCLEYRLHTILHRLSKVSVFGVSSASPLPFGAADVSSVAPNFCMVRATSIDQRQTKHSNTATAINLLFADSWQTVSAGKFVLWNPPKNSGAIDRQVEVMYYIRPAQIQKNDTQLSSFDDAVYNTIINLAVAILSSREALTPRAMKKFQRYLTGLRFITRDAVVVPREDV